MSPLTRGIRLVLWLGAAGVVVIGALNIGLELVRHYLKHTPVSVWHCGLWSLLLILGGLLALAAPRLARQLGDDESE
jgi:hypothetical protein